MTKQQIEYNLHSKSRGKDLAGFRRYSYRKLAKVSHSSRIAHALYYGCDEDTEIWKEIEDLKTGKRAVNKCYSPFIQEIKQLLKTHKQQSFNF